MSAERLRMPPARPRTNAGSSGITSRLRRVYGALVKGSPIERFWLLRKIATWLLPSYRLKWPYLLWWEDESFNRYLERFDELSGLNTDRRWMLYQLMRLAVTLEGDTAECGAYQGAGSYFIADMNRRAGAIGRTHFVIDSFRGLSQPEAEDGGYWAAGDLAASAATVRRNLEAYAADVEIVEGWIPACLEPLSGRRFAFVHIDVDLYQPTHDSLAFFYPRMVPNGVILCDDYGLTTCPGATKAFDEFLADKAEKAVALSAGGGFVIRGRETLPPIS